MGLFPIFSTVTAEVVDCPNLKEKPFMLASEGNKTLCINICCLVIKFEICDLYLLLSYKMPF